MLLKKSLFMKTTLCKVLFIVSVAHLCRTPRWWCVHAYMCGVYMCMRESVSDKFILNLLFIVFILIALWVSLVPKLSWTLCCIPDPRQVFYMQFGLYLSAASLFSFLGDSTSWMETTQSWIWCGQYQHQHTSSYLSSGGWKTRIVYSN